ncbi:MAG: SPOR domain-containing protein [Prevotellaceae bacterium]|nr:SPOR domain-containing protein [Prevotellaceae bacterium]
MKFLSLLLALLFCASATAQNVGRLIVYAPPSVENLLLKHVAHNQRHPHIEGYRIRVYRDNSSKASKTSQEIADALAVQFASVPTYRDYTNPYFKVSVGDFRSKDEALRLLPRIKQLYPTAYIVTENIHLPEL